MDKNRMALNEVLSLDLIPMPSVNKQDTLDGNKHPFLSIELAPVEVQSSSSEPPFEIDPQRGEKTPVFRRLNRIGNFGNHPLSGLRISQCNVKVAIVLYPVAQKDRCEFNYLFLSLHAWRIITKVS